MTKFKKSNVPIVLFVIGVFLVCAFALLTFFISDFNFSNSFVGVSIMETLNARYEEYLIYKNEGISESSLQAYFDVSTDTHGKFLSLEQKRNRISPSFSTNWKKEELLFSAKQYFP